MSDTAKTDVPPPPPRPSALDTRIALGSTASVSSISSNLSSSSTLSSSLNVDNTLSPIASAENVNNGGANTPSPSSAPPVRRRPPPPPPPQQSRLPTQRAQSNVEAEFETLKYYLKQAMEAKDCGAMKDLVSRASELKVTDELITQAQNFLAEKESEDRKTTMETLKVYLKQGIELKNREALKLALEKVDSLTKSTQTMGSSRLNSDFYSLIDKARKLLATLEKENQETIKFYLKQGMQMKSRDVLKEAMDKAQSANFETIDRELMNQAADMLRQLDAQHLIKFYLSSAIKQKDEEALEAALGQAKTLGMGQDVKEVMDATKMAQELKAKQTKKSFGSRIKGVFEKKDKKDKKETYDLFGGPLAESVKRSDRDVPKICYQCIEFLEAKGLEEPGLFRVPGSKDVMEVISRNFEDELEVKLDDVHDTAGVLKQYLRQLPEPLIPYEHYEAFIRVGQQYNPKDPRRCDQFRTLLTTVLPKENYALLRYLTGFLYNVSRHSDVNKMNVDNIAIVFAPNLLRPAVETPQSMLVEMPVSIGVIATFIDKYELIFLLQNNSNSNASTSSSSSTSTVTTSSSSTASTHPNTSLSSLAPSSSPSTSSTPSTSVSASTTSSSTTPHHIHSQSTPISSPLSPHTPHTHSQSQASLHA